MKAKLKYNLVVHDDLYPKDTWVDVLGVSDMRVRKMIPNIERNTESGQVALLLPGRSHPLIHSLDLVEFGE